MTKCSRVRIHIGKLVLLSMRNLYSRGMSAHKVIHMGPQFLLFDVALFGDIKMIS